MRKIKENKGITLIALVVTIIVLLILAGVSIGMLTGDNGLLTQAEDAKIETRGGTVQEKVDLWKSEVKLKEHTNGTALSEEDMLKDLIDNKYAYEEEIDRDSKTITIGTRVISYKVNDKDTIKIIVDSGEYGTVELPISYKDAPNCKVDWGDGTFDYGDGTAERGKVANIGEGIYTGSIEVPPAIGHIYGTPNEEYEVTISGEVSLIDSIYCNTTTKDQIKEIIQWGETGLMGVQLSGCTNLRKIGSPSVNSFVNIDEHGFMWAFAGCRSLTTIPADLFKNCPNVSSFERTFYNCTSLTEIPANLFSNCPNVTSFNETFYNCTSLKGAPINLWERV